MERGAKVSGARFYFLTGVGAQLELAILNAAMGVATAQGFSPMITPTLVRPETMRGTGFLGSHADEVYYLEKDELYLVGTSEVALAGYHTDEILDLSDGPLRYAGWSAATAARPAPRAATPAASSACTNSTRSRCSPTRGPRTRPPNTSSSSRSRSRCSRLSNCRIA